MSDDKELERSDDQPADEDVTLSAEPDDPGEGLGVGGNIASLMYDVENDVEHQGDNADDDPGTGLGTGGEVRAPQN